MEAQRKWSNGLWSVSPRLNRARRFLQLTQTLWLLAGFQPNAFPSGTGVATVGSPIPVAAGESGRQIVRIESTGGLLVARPRSGSVAMITAYAPGCEPDNVVIRERPAEGNSTLIQVSSPACWRESLVQATLFLRRGMTRARHTTSARDGWVDCRVQTIPLQDSTGMDGATSHLTAVVVENLDLIQLYDGDAAEVPPTVLQKPWIADLRTRAGRAAWHLRWPAFALVVFVLLSWSVHRATSLADRG